MVGIFRVSEVIGGGVATSNGGPEWVSAPGISAVQAGIERSCLNVEDGGRDGVLPSAACYCREHET